MLVREIRNLDTVSRAELSRLTGLSASTVSARVRDLLQAELVEEGAFGPSTGGRPPKLLRLDRSRIHLMGVEMGASHISVVRHDLHGTLIESCDRSHDVQNDPMGTLQQVLELCRRAMPTADSGTRIAGVGVAMPCPIDPAHPDQLSPRILPAWKDARPATWLQEQLDVPVFMENDATCGALAEQWWGAGSEFDTFAFIKLGTGVGSGLVLGGRVYRGAGGVSGEIGHTAVVQGGRYCRCGLQGCLEAHVGSGALVRQAEDGLAAGAPSSLQPGLDLDALLAAAEADDRLARRTLERAGSLLGVAIANLVNLVNPGRVVLGGRVTTAGDVLFEPIRSTMVDRALWDAVAEVEVVPSELGRTAIATGAATVVLDNILSSPLSWQHKEVA